MFGIVRFMIMTAGMCNVNKLECLFLKGSGLFITWLKKQDKYEGCVHSVPGTSGIWVEFR